VQVHPRRRKYQSTTARPTPTIKIHRRILRGLIAMSELPQNWHRWALAGWVTPQWGQEGIVHLSWQKEGGPPGAVRPTVTKK
jgi:hypothetical protein